MNKFKSILFGVGTSIGLTVVCILVFSLILLNTNISESYIDVIVTVLFGICIMIGSFISSKIKKKHGVLNGLLVTIINILFMYLISSAVVNDFSIGTNTAIMICVDIILGIVGGVIGVNIKK